jgi:hypothetical protein
VLGADNVYLSTQGHTESVGSAESFAAQYEFFLGHAPATTNILPEPPGEVEVAGRALSFPANTGLEGATVQLWEVNDATGARKTAAPLVEAVLDSTGNFGPWPVNGRQRYEISLLRQTPEGGVRTQHFYYEPWIRDNDLLRLNASPLDSDLAQNIDTSAESSGASIVRQKEWWGNNQLGQSDRLRIATTSASWGAQAPFDIVNAATAPFSGSTIAMITFDNDSDETTHTDVPVPLGPFLSGIDVWYPAADPPDGTISFIHDQRNFGTQQVVNTPNWASSDHFMTVNFRDWVQPVDSWPECVRLRPSPCR